MENILLRAGYGKGCVDLLFRRRAKECEENKTEFGVYWLSYAYNSEMAKEEARYCLETIEEYNIKMPVYVFYTLDSARYASSKGCSVKEDQITEWMKAFCQEMRRAGREASYYIDIDKYEKDKVY